MWQEPPPKPSPEAEQALSQLAHYYRQLIAYHQQAAAVASSKLAQIEALNASNNLSLNSPWQYSAPSYPLGASNPPELVAELEETTSLPEVRLPPKEDLSKVLRQVLKASQGTMLRLDYLALEVGEKLQVFPLYQPQLKSQLQQILEQGVEFGLWASVPDSPDCWTYDLKDFPDLVDSTGKKSRKPKRTRASKKKPYNLSRLPMCERIEDYGTLTGAIRECLRQFAPQPLDAHQVMAWMYPNGLKEKDKARAYQAISDGLNKGCSRKHWQRIDVGIYTVNDDE